LYQLPPHWRLNLPRLESFLELLPQDLIHVFEFRDRSWFAEEVPRLLKEKGAVWCVHDMPGLLFGRPVTASTIYVRFYGAAGRYQGGYPDPVLEEWWVWMAEQLAKGKNLYVYFNNDADAHAVRDALRLKHLASSRGETSKRIRCPVA